MVEKILKFEQGVTLLGGGDVGPSQLEDALALAPNLICADGGANRLGPDGPTPEAIIGDLDSLVSTDQWRRRLGDRLVHVAEQDSTDFEKCVTRIAAPFIIGVGFLGRRQDHSLAAMHTLTQFDRPIILLGTNDLCFAAHRPVALTLPVGARMSIFPLRPVKGEGGAGLKWPIDDLRLEAGRQIGTSNEAAATRVEFGFDAPGAVIFLDPAHLEAVLRSFDDLFQPTI